MRLTRQRFAHDEAEGKSEKRPATSAPAMADRLSARGRRDSVLISGRRQPPDELPRPSVVSLHCGGETCLAAAPLTFQQTTSKQRLRRARTGFSPISAYRGSRSSKKRSSPPGRIY